jgi:hypothetical protein
VARAAELSVLALFGNPAIDEMECVANVARHLLARRHRFAVVLDSVGLRSVPVILSAHVVSRSEDSQDLAPTTKKHGECRSHEVANVIAADELEMPRSGQSGPQPVCGAQMASRMQG